MLQIMKKRHQRVRSEGIILQLRKRELGELQRGVLYTYDMGTYSLYAKVLTPQAPHCMLIQYSAGLNIRPRFSRQHLWLTYHAKNYPAEQKTHLETLERIFKGSSRQFGALQHDLGKGMVGGRAELRAVGQVGLKVLTLLRTTPPRPKVGGPTLVR